MKISFYVDSDNFLILDDVAVAPRSISIKWEGITIKDSIGRNFENLAVTDLLKEDRTPYLTMNDFRTVAKSFFVDASAGTGAGSDIEVSPVYSTNGVDDGNGNIIGTTRFVLPIDADITKAIWAYEGSLLNMGFTVNAPLRAIDFTVAPGDGNGIIIFYHKKVTTT